MIPHMTQPWQLWWCCCWCRGGVVVSKAQAYWGAEQPVGGSPLVQGFSHPACGSEVFVHAQGGGFAWRAFDRFYSLRVQAGQQCFVVLLYRPSCSHCACQCARYREDYMPKQGDTRPGLSSCAGQSLL